MDDNKHGTHCAGVVAGTRNNNLGIAGIAKNVKIMSLKFLNESGSGFVSDAILAIEYAVDNGAKILSNSWGGYEESLTLKRTEHGCCYASFRWLRFNASGCYG